MGTRDYTSSSEVLAALPGSRIHAPKSARKSKSVTFGSVTLKRGVTNPADLERNIEAGRMALKRAKSAFVRPGVRLSLPKGVAKYYADPERADALIREIDGRRERVVMVNGKFEKAE
ncbi:MAG: hypothetical protein JWM36_3580 [Hyphomicrobiales bacterium]|nr:hypothetical protein [Hyphomicrobiales bacterium]